MAARLSRLSISGFRSIRHLDHFEPGNLTVLIGANGAGKSNLISFFRAQLHHGVSDRAPITPCRHGPSAFLAARWTGHDQFDRRVT